MWHEVLTSYMWLVATTLDSAALDDSWEPGEIVV